MKTLDSHYDISRKQIVFWVAVLLALIVFSLTAVPNVLADWPDNNGNNRACVPSPGVGFGPEYWGGFQGIGNSTCCEIVDGARVVCFSETQDLTGYDFSGLFLRHSLMGVDLIDTIHHSTDWSGSVFAGDLSGADFTGANLSNTDLRATNITQAQLDSTASCMNAELPVGLTCHNETGNNN